MGNLSDTLSNIGDARVQGIAGLVDLLSGKNGPTDLGGVLPPPGSVPGFNGGHFGGVGQGPSGSWDPGPVPAAPPGYNGGDGSDLSPDMQATQDAIVRAFKPKKRSIWGVLGDAILLHSGHKGPFFADRVEKKNFERALEGFTHDPLESIRRVATFNPEAAWKMFGQHRDDARQEENQETVRNNRREGILRQLSNVLGAVGEKGEGYEVAAQIYNDGLKRNGFDDVAPLPPEFDPELVSTYYLRGMNPNQQEMMEYRRVSEARKAAQGDRRLDQGDKRLEQGDRRLDQADVKETNDVANDIRTEAGRNSRAANKSKSVGSTSYKDSNGSEVVFNSDKSKAKVRRGGKTYYYDINSDGTKTLVKVK